MVLIWTNLHGLIYHTLCLYIVIGEGGEKNLETRAKLDSSQGKVEEFQDSKICGQPDLL